MLETCCPRPRNLSRALAAALAIWMVISAGDLRGQEEILAETPIVQAPVEAAPIAEPPITDAERAHWSFQPVVRQPLPEVKERAWLCTPIDAFISQKLEANALAPAAEASRATLIRRLSFDLTGLPPTPEELAAFENDASPDAHERLLDRLLASPAYGERWGQHWLDLARFAETDGFEHDKIREEAWQYRDWVIAALNADMPYDQFVRLQVAGDEESGVRRQESGDRRQGTGDSASHSSPSPQPLAPSPSRVATMFALAGPDMPDINDQVERRHNRLNELTATVGAVFLGLQMGCAQCHDHKYDPLTQGDFYRLRAVFEPAVPALKRDQPYLALAQQKDAPPARFWIRGDHRRPGPEVQPAFPRIADRAPAGSASEEANPPRDIRTEFARWLASDENPLTSRVIANRVWQGHFGRGICQTPSDFGLMSANPTHPELLDWLAVELRERSWRLKHLHRLIAGSATYRQASKSPEVHSPSSVADPESELYSRFPRRRLEGEAVRDAMLASAGLLNSHAGGPGVMPPLPYELVGTLLKNQWIESPFEDDHYRRSIYVFARRNLRYPIFEAFDRPDANASCPARNRSTTAPQSLLLFNSEFSLLAARHLAGRVLADAGTPEDQITRLYAIALARRPTAKETATLAAFLGAQQQRLAEEAREAEELALPQPCPEDADPYGAAALVDVSLAIMNANEFVYVD